MSEFDQTPQEPEAAPEPTEAAEAAAPAFEQAPPPVYGQAPPPPTYEQAPPPVYEQPVYPPPPAYEQPQYQAPPPYGQPLYAAEKPMHIPSLILGIIALITLWFTIGISGIIFGAIGMSLAKKASATHKATAGRVLSLIGLILGIIILVIMIVAIAILGAAGLSLMALAGM